VLSSYGCDLAVQRCNRWNVSSSSSHVPDEPCFRCQTTPDFRVCVAATPKVNLGSKYQVPKTAALKHFDRIPLYNLISRLLSKRVKTAFPFESRTTGSNPVKPVFLFEYWTATVNSEQTKIQAHLPSRWSESCSASETALHGADQRFTIVVRLIEQNYPRGSKADRFWSERRIYQSISHSICVQRATEARNSRVCGSNILLTFALVSIMDVSAVVGIAAKSNL
jgi:hypothetical protein